MKKENNKIKKILNIQLIFMLLIIVFIVLTFINPSLAKYREIALGLVLLFMAYSNHVVYKRRNMTILYIIFGLLLIIPNILRLI